MSTNFTHTTLAGTLWPQLLEDVRHGRLQRRYDGGLAEIGKKFNLLTNLALAR